MAQFHVPIRDGTLAGAGAPGLAAALCSAGQLAQSRNLRVPSEADLDAEAPQEVAEGPLQLGAAGTDLPTVMVEGKDRPSMAHRTIHRLSLIHI